MSTCGVHGVADVQCMLTLWRAIMSSMPYCAGVDALYTYPSRSTCASLVQSPNESTSLQYIGRWPYTITQSAF